MSLSKDSVGGRCWGCGEINGGCRGVAGDGCATRFKDGTVGSSSGGMIGSGKDPVGSGSCP